MRRESVRSLLVRNNVYKILGGKTDLWFPYISIVDHLISSVLPDQNTARHDLMVHRKLSAVYLMSLCNVVLKKVL